MDTMTTTLGSLSMNLERCKNSHRRLATSLFSLVQVATEPASLQDLQQMFKHCGHTLDYLSATMSNIGQIGIPADLEDLDQLLQGCKSDQEYIAERMLQVQQHPLFAPVSDMIMQDERLCLGIDNRTSDYPSDGLEEAPPCFKQSTTATEPTMPGNSSEQVVKREGPPPNAPKGPRSMGRIAPVILPGDPATQLSPFQPTGSAACSLHSSQLPCAENDRTFGIGIENTVSDPVSDTRTCQQIGNRNIDAIPSTSTVLDEMYNNVLGGLHEVRILGQVKEQGGNIAGLKQRLQDFHENVLLKPAKLDTTDSSDWAAYFQELSSIDAKLTQIAASAGIVLAKATPLTAAQIERQNHWLYNRKGRSRHHQHEDAKNISRVHLAQKPKTVVSDKGQRNHHRPLKEDALFSNTVTLLRQLQEKPNRDQSSESHMESNRPQKRRLRADDFF